MHLPLPAFMPSRAGHGMALLARNAGIRLLQPLRAVRECVLFDYNPVAAAYWFIVVAVGALSLERATVTLVHLAPDAVPAVALGVGAAALAGWFPLRKQNAKDGIAAGEVFVFLLLIAHGPAAATVASAAEAACISWRLSRRWSSRIAGPAMAAITMMACGGMFEFARNLPLGAAARGGVLLTTLTVVACICFVVNSMLVSVLGMLKRVEVIGLAPVLDHFASLGLAYAASASLAGLVYIGFLQLGPAIVAALVPIIGIMLATHRFYYRRQEAEEATRKANEDAARRELAQATEHVRALTASERRFQSTFNDAAIGMALLTMDTGVIVQCNDALARLLGRPVPALCGRRLADFVDPRDALRLGQGLVGIAGTAGEGAAPELRWILADGGACVATVHCSTFAESVENVRYLIVQLQDVTARLSAERRLRYIAFNDELTALPNRVHFCEALVEEVGMSAREAGRHFAVLFLDVDRFKVVNDSLGHGAGDIFLKGIASRLLGAVRPGDLVARFGGDEFAVLARLIRDERDARDVADRIRAAFNHPIAVQGTEVSTSASIGVTTSHGARRTADEILRDVDIAMYRAKAGGPGQAVFFDPERHANATERLHMENDLRNAIATGGLSLQYQPLLRIDSGELAGFEALVRWHHPERGLLSPTAFIALAEETGMIAGITDWVVREACMQLSAWQRRWRAARPLTMHANISGSDLYRPEFPDIVARALRESGLSPACLTLELTESTLLHRFEIALATLTEIERTGVRISIDDFGTGYSSLSYLSQLPFSSLKIDRSFIVGLGGGSRDAEIVRTIIGLANALGKKVVAEGIENDRQLEILRHLGCGLGQGYHLSRPLTVDSAERLFAPFNRTDGSRGRDLAVVA